MGPRAPSAILVVDANIILGVLLGRRSRPVFDFVIGRRTVITSARAVEEVRGVVRSGGRLSPSAVGLGEALFADLPIVEPATYSGLVQHAARALCEAVPSRNGSRNDAHILACAWIYDADVWSHDRDFAGTGWRSWSSSNLVERLDAAPDRVGPDELGP